MAKFLNFRGANGEITDGINLDKVMSWSIGISDKGEPFVLVNFAVMGQDLTRGTGPQPWSMRLTNPEREQWLAYQAKQK